MLGADISEWQGVWSPDQFAQYGFVIIRYGTGENPGGSRPQPWEDKCWAANWRNANGRTIRGAYWYADPRRDAPEVQAQRFVAGVTAAGYGPGDLPLMLDYEQDMGTFDYRGWARAFLNTVEQTTNRVPILYISASRISGWLQSDQSFARYPLMVAAYGPNDGQDHPVSTPWPFTIHQYTSTPHDLDYADDNTLRALVSGGDDDMGYSTWSDLEKLAFLKDVRGVVLATLRGQAFLPNQPTDAEDCNVAGLVLDDRGNPAAPMPTKLNDIHATVAAIASELKGLAAASGQIDVNALLKAIGQKLES